MRRIRWDKVIISLLVIVIIVMLLIPAELTYTQLNQVKVGMTLNEAKQLLGESNRRVLFNLPITNPGDTLPIGVQVPGAWWHPTLNASIPMKQSRLFELTYQTWIGKSHMLLIQAENDIIVVASIAPITCTGGGIQGCIDSLKECWNKWWN